MKPSGVFIRKDGLTISASNEDIRSMIRYSNGDEFETMRSLNQDLSFEYASAIFKKNDIDFSRNQSLSFGITRSNDDLYTNLGLLLSDQCPFTIKVATFTDQSNPVFANTREFSGSIFKAAEKAYQYIDLHNHNKLMITGLQHVSSRDYPEFAIREALCNAIIHRDYGYSGSIIVNIYTTAIEVISIGGLVKDLTLIDIRNGLSQSRNPKLAEVFHSIRFAKSYGIGIRRIFALYENCSCLP